MTLFLSKLHDVVQHGTLAVGGVGGSKFAVLLLADAVENRTGANRACIWLIQRLRGSRSWIVDLHLDLEIETHVLLLRKLERSLYLTQFCDEIRDAVSRG
jgi:hypothetical protein